MTQPLATVFAALADEMRWSILARIADEPASASRLAGELPISRQGIMQHLDVLHDAGLVTASRRGREVLYSPRAARLEALGRELQLVGKAWDRRLARIKVLAEAGR